MNYHTISPVNVVENSEVTLDVCMEKLLEKILLSNFFDGINKLSGNYAV